MEQITSNFINSMINDFLIWQKIKIEPKNQFKWKKLIYQYLESHDIIDLPDIYSDIFNNFINKILLTIKKRRKLREYAQRKNVINKWAISLKTLKTYVKRHRDGDYDKKFMIESRLEDANFHKINQLLKEGQYDIALKMIENE